jgi:ABC-type multidrug transport system fused ATPase/permease subunit
VFTLQPSLTGLLLAVIPVVSLAAVQYGRYLRILRKEFQDNLATANVVAEEAISSARTVTIITFQISDISYIKFVFIKF